MSSGPQSHGKPITLNTLRKRVAEGRKISALTCYDATTARWLARAGVEILLVGDTAAEMILGHDQTIHAPLPFMLAITAAVKRAAPDCFVMADMPFMSYQADDAEAVRNAGRFLTEGLADAVKLEVDAEYGELVGKLSRAGIPVVAHIGSLPQQVRRRGGYTATGRSAAEARSLVELAELMEARGAVMLLIEAVPAEVSEAIVARVSIPLIGCGGGPACHGHVVVLYDLLGMTDWQPPFARPQAAIGQQIADTASAWVAQVHSGEYLRHDHPYSMTQEDRRRFVDEG